MDVFYETGGMMDTSKENIEKCSKATEIQEAWEPTIGDWYCYYGTTLLGIIELREFRRSGTFPYKNKVTFLPRQDQLQSMVIRPTLCPENPEIDVNISAPDQLEDFFRITCRENYCYYNKFLTQDQLWLAFVMKEKYNKTWNGTDWVKGGGKS